MKLMRIGCPLLFLFSLRHLCSSFDPYRDNSGSVVGLRGSTYALFACDSRLSEHYSIQTRNFTRIFSVGHDMMFAGTGCIADLLELCQDLKQLKFSYRFASEGKLFVEAAGYRLSRRLYSRRKFPFYSFCGLAGINDDGKAWLFRYDALGSSEFVDAFCCGRGEQLIQPTLDSLTNMEEGFSSWGHDIEAGIFTSTSTSQCKKDIMDFGDDSMISDGLKNEMKMNFRSTIGIDMTKDEAVEMVVNTFRSAAKRDITIGDELHVWVMESINEDECTLHPSSGQKAVPKSKSKSKSFIRLHKSFHRLSRG